MEFICKSCTYAEHQYRSAFKKSHWLKRAGISNKSYIVCSSWIPLCKSLYPVVQPQSGQFNGLYSKKVCRSHRMSHSASLVSWCLLSTSQEVSKESNAADPFLAISTLKLQLPLVSESTWKTERQLASCFLVVLQWRFAGTRWMSLHGLANLEE